MDGRAGIVSLLRLLLAVQAVLPADSLLKSLNPIGVRPAPQPNEVRYDFRYAVDDAASGVMADRWEMRLGEYVKGAYSLLGPDGKVRIVDYEVDGARGFHAVVRTHYPANTLLSGQQLAKSFQEHKPPPVNVLTDMYLPEERRPVPGNFHSTRPNYYLAFAKDRSSPPPDDVSSASSLQPPPGDASPSIVILPPPVPLRSHIVGG